MKPQIRVMTIYDYEAVYDLWLHTEGMGMDPIDDSFEGVSKFLKRNPNTCFVAEDRGEIAGAILGGYDGRRGHIYHAAVDAEYRGKGVGKDLVNAVIAAFRLEGVTKASIVVFRNNDAGNMFWLATGWEKRLDLVYYNYKLSRVPK